MATERQFHVGHLTTLTLRCIYNPTFALNFRSSIQVDLYLAAILTATRAWAEPVRPFLLFLASAINHRRLLPSMSFFRKVSDSESESDSEEERMSDYEEDAEKNKATASGTTPAKVSRFLKGSDSGSSSSEESDDDDDSDDSDEDDSEEEKKAGGAKKQSKFLRGASDDSDSEEDVKKIVKSAKDKRVDEMDAVVRSMENAQRIDDWVAISKGEQEKLMRRG